MSSLSSLFKDLESKDYPFDKLYEIFIPIMHTILKIWENSNYYASPPRLVVLIREICNAIITKAQSYIEGQEIFTLIMNKETGEACEKL